MRTPRCPSGTCRHPMLPASILARAVSHMPVISTSAILLVLNYLVNGKPLVGRHKVLLLTHDVLAGEQRSIIAARVAGVPIPASFRLAFSSASSSSLPAFSIADNRLLSVCSGFGWSAFEQIHAGRVANILPLGVAAGWRLLHPRPFPARRTRHATPVTFITDPFTVKSVSPPDSKAVVTSFTHLPEKASSIRPATSS